MFTFLNFFFEIIPHNFCVEGTRLGISLDFFFFFFKARLNIPNGFLNVPKGRYVEKCLFIIACRICSKNRQVANPLPKENLF